MRVIEAVRRPVTTMPPDATFREVAERMSRDGVGSVVVVDDGGAATGLVTDRDLVTRALAHGNVDGRVDAVMSTDLVVVGADSDLRDVVRRFASHAVRRVVVEREGVAVGVISVDDLLVDLVADLTDVIKPVTAEVLFGHHDADLPATLAGAAQ